MSTQLSEIMEKEKEVILIAQDDNDKDSDTVADKKVQEEHEEHHVGEGQATEFRVSEAKGDFCLEGEYQDDFETEQVLYLRNFKQKTLSQEEDEEDSEDDDEYLDVDEDLEFELEPGISLSNLQFGQDIESLTHSCLFCGVDYETDLQLAAELGKTLLERNKDLETSLKHQQAIIDDQAQEIEYLNKQTVALREVNDSRVNVYEQLEESITELEKTNKKLIEENHADKSRIKSLTLTVNRLEAKCEELRVTLDNLRQHDPLLSSPNLEHRKGKCGQDFLGEKAEEPLHNGCEMGRHVLTTTSQESNWESNCHQQQASSLNEEQFVVNELQDIIGKEEIDRVPSLPNSLSHHHFHHHNNHHNSTETSSSGYSSSSIEYQFHSSNSVSPVSSPFRTGELESPSEQASDETSDDHSGPPSGSASALFPTVIEDEAEEIHSSSEDENWNTQHKALLEQILELETICERLKCENAELKEDSQENPPFLERPKSVEEEVSHIDIVRSGKLCRRCLGPMDEYSPVDLISQASCQILESARTQINAPSYSEHNTMEEETPMSLHQELLMTFQEQFKQQEKQKAIEEESQQFQPLHLDKSLSFELENPTSYIHGEAKQEDESFANSEILVTLAKCELKSPTRKTTKTNYKEIFKEMFDLLAQAHDI